MKFKNLNFEKINKTINQILLYSAALSFYTIFALVPLILLIFTIFTSSPFFAEFYEKLQTFILSNIIPTNQEIAKHYINNFLQNSYKMGIIGAFYLVITSILFFDNYETIISKIFNEEKRDLFEKIKLYWTMITLFPLLFAGFVYVSVKIQFFLNKFTNIHFIYIVPFLLIWLLFFLSYSLTIYKKKPKVTLIVSFFISIIFLISKNIFIYYLLLNKTYTTIYGSVAILLFLFLWIYISWIIYITGLFIIKKFS